MKSAGRRDPANELKARGPPRVVPGPDRPRWSVLDARRCANPALDVPIERIDAALVTYARDALIEQAWRMILADIVVIPLHRQVIV